MADRKATQKLVSNPVTLMQLLESIIEEIDALDDLTDELADDHDTQCDAFDGIVAKLDSDNGITDTNYAALWGVGGSEGNAWPAKLSESKITRLTASTT